MARALVLGLAAAWGLLVYLNALGAQPPPFALALPFFWPTIGRFTLRGFLAAQRMHAVWLADLAAYDLLAWAIGRRLLALLGAGRLRGVTGAGAALLVGGGAAGLAAFGAALAGLAFPRLAWALAAGGAVLLWQEVRAPGAGAALRQALGAARARARSLHPGLAILVAVVTAGGLAGALAPEVVLDATRYFLEIPHRALVLHRLVPMEGFPLSLTPLLPHAVAMPLLALAGETPVKLLSWQAGWLVAALIHETLGEDRRTAPFAALAGAAWLCLLNVPILAQSAMADLPVAAWVAFAVRVQFGARPVLAGVLWGGALGCKYTCGAMFAAMAAGQWLWPAGTAARDRRAMLAAAAAAVLIWPVRNGLAAGLPLYPLSLPAALARSVHSPMPFFFLPAHWAAERTASAVLAAPFVLATSVHYWDSLLSPLLVALLPLAFTRATLPAVRLGLAGSLLAWAWAFGNVGRYLYPIAPVLLVEAVRGGVRLSPGSAAWGRGDRPRLGPLRLILLLPLAYDAVVSFGWASRMNDPMVVALGRESRAAYLRNFLKPAPATFEMGGLLAGTFRPATRYYLAGELRSWSWPGLAWFDVEFATSNLSRWAEAAPDPGRLRVAFRQRGIRDLVAYEQPRRLGHLAAGPGGWTPRSRGVLRGFFARYARRRARAGDALGSYAWYDLLPRPGPAGPVPVPLPAVLEDAPE